ncbi:hypothetical protein L1987_05011 [Smallanthus sonchifolius]|uniref:Uncharacterized protein n=1 Tax=Smallanthus sonchifolius TaxID=185202 RepID=A0ACB9JU54_9ASTR|nr:hypothetical protein L1987_05011 [Smallanthus sonchifolius]
MKQFTKELSDSQTKKGGKEGIEPGTIGSDDGNYSLDLNEIFTYLINFNLIIFQLVTSIKKKNIEVFIVNFMAITLKKTWLVIFVALVLVSGTTRAEVDLGRKVGFGPTKNPVTGDTEDGKGDSGVDNHHYYGDSNRPKIGN